VTAFLVSFSLGSDAGGAVVMVSGIENSKEKIIFAGGARYSEDEFS
jgi:hypothetical protein